MSVYQAENAKHDAASTVETASGVTYVNPGGPSSSGAGGWLDWNQVTDTGEVFVTLYGQNPGTTARPVMLEVGAIKVAIPFAGSAGWHDSAPVKVNIPAGAKIRTSYGSAGGPNIDSMTVVPVAAPAIPPPATGPIAVPTPTSRPSAATTGTTGIALTASDAKNLKIADGATFRNLRISGQVTITGRKNISFINCVIDAGGGQFCIRCDKCTGITVQRCELKNAKATAIYGDGYSALGCYVHQIAGDGFKALHNVLIQGCYVTQLGWNDPEAHADGVQVSGGANIRIIGNYFDMPRGVPNTKSNSAIFIQSTCSNITVSGNWCRAGGAVIHFWPESGTGNSVTGNTFYTGCTAAMFGNVSSAVTWSGNLTDTGTVANKGSK